ncbi:unnamed protein product, partial [marine sediment metagenome]
AATAPTDPANGQLWLDTVTKVLKFYDPTEGSDEQTTSDSYTSLFEGDAVRVAQRKTISNRYITKLGFWLSKYYSPTGDVTFTVRKVSDDEVILTKVWGNASALTTEATYKEVTFTTPVLVNEEVRLCVEFSGGGIMATVKVEDNSGDVKACENEWRYISEWTDWVPRDLKYKVSWSPGWAAV